ncbi:hypothetical protein PILCRDRAFT_199043 [Piloderma croceum F 1598]|jgi:hypothetical protein|uniref:Uncharacterized protein n=1 Tax=Piloderma croceum (strain F 1598) TaxID=765440 RepID=A0A0C3GDS2_PILCF|nr:hypothetical protein PILCRDRAFT_199043 [Piloderma croceum F 1598]
MRFYILDTRTESTAVREILVREKFQEAGIHHTELLPTHQDLLCDCFSKETILSQNSAGNDAMSMPATKTCFTAVDCEALRVDRCTIRGVPILLQSSRVD